MGVEWVWELMGSVVGVCMRVCNQTLSTVHRVVEGFCVDSEDIPQPSQNARTQGSPYQFCDV